jgi:hypothetical protein
MKPASPITQIPAETPPRAGDTYEDPDFGPVRLLKPGGGDSWICVTSRGNRLYLRPKLMRRITT